jgi:zinc/manganese transport system substrate-binding protein
MKNLKKTMTAALSALMCSVVLFASSAVRAELNIFATVPEWGALAQALGGDQVKVFVATAAQQDPHHIQARPSLIARARNAQLVIATGAELEIGWLPIVQRDSGNRSIQTGQPGYLEAAQYVTLLDIPKSVDRSMGDVHAEGNPHIQTDPRNLLPIAQALSARMAQLDPSQSQHYQNLLARFVSDWQTRLSQWALIAKPLHGVRIWAQHDGFPYMNAWLGLIQIGTLEPRPGVEPSIAYLSEVLQRQKSEQARMIVVASYLSDAPSKWFSEKSGLPVAILPFTVGGNAQTKTLAALYDETISRLLKALEQGNRS